MKHPLLLSQDNSALVLIDVQDKLLHALDQWHLMLAQVVKLVKAAHVLNVPILVTEQYPKGLGGTKKDLSDLILNVPRIEKTEFSCFDSAEFRRQLEVIQAKQLILVGGETHICVMQTALQGINRGYTVHVVADAVSSRAQFQKELGLKKIYQAGGVISSVEMVIYEWLEKANTEAFKEILPLIK